MADRSTSRARDSPFDAHRIYIYLCADGITRQRCGRHVHTERSMTPVRIWHVEPPNERRTCLECEYNRLAAL
jgi:hypothetical protein